MKILVVGAGATGGYFGGKLIADGRDVTFLVRERRASTLRERGLRIVGLGEPQVLAPKLVQADNLSGPFDVVLITVKAGGLAGAIADLAPAVGPHTVIIPFLNGMAHMDALERAFGAGAVLGSVVRVVTTLNDDGDILQLAPLAQWDFGEQTGAPSDRVRAILAELDVPGFTVQAVPDARALMWHKWVFIVTAGVVTCLMRGSVGAIVAVPGGLEFIHAALAESVAVSTQAGYPVPDEALVAALTMLTEPGSAFTSSLYRDVVAGLPNESEHLLGDFARRAADLGLSTPLIDLALMQLRVHAAAAL
ncbi:ketopantoate reductase family protein [Arthrobacter cryoconiti]|uniref:2-dehydropantoate 2-reductase n=1 Tax=Arthrobacter cryoconiti TaxID=748907 RepID=A0ABV8R154_9MICC|nr:ketopantoate reductase family protein [Arthrobacter cryoconiti]MCC9067654.1 ketopantoate reductase family protein [Arthrobacter cryoconiti]